MDHDVVVRQKITERYLLGELEPAARDEFEEHFFDCSSCAVDVRAGAMFVEQSKVALATEAPELRSYVSGSSSISAKAGRLTGITGWFRPAFALPVLALLLAVIGYQNLVTVPHMQQAMNTPQVLPWAAVAVGTYGSETPVITTAAGKGFLLFVRIPPVGGYSKYVADLYNPAGKVEWSLIVPVPAGQEAAGRDQWPVEVPAAERAAGSYSLAVRGITPAGESKEVGRASFELQIQK